MAARCDGTIFKQSMRCCLKYALGAILPERGLLTLRDPDRPDQRLERPERPLLPRDGTRERKNAEDENERA